MNLREFFSRKSKEEIEEVSSKEIPEVSDEKTLEASDEKRPEASGKEIIKKNGHELCIEQRGCEYKVVLKLDDDYRLDVNIFTPKYHMLEGCKELADYLLSLDNSLILSEVYKNVINIAEVYTGCTPCDEEKQKAKFMEEENEKDVLQSECEEMFGSKRSYDGFKRLMEQFTEYEDEIGIHHVEIFYYKFIYDKNLVKNPIMKQLLEEFSVWEDGRTRCRFKYVVGKILKIKGKIQVYSVFENGETFSVWRKGDQKYFSNDSIYVYSKNMDCDCLVTTRHDLAEANMIETLKRVKKKLNELMEFVK